MSKKFLLALSLFFLFPALALAQGDENVTTRRSDRAVEVQEIRQERVEDQSQIRSRVAENHANRLERRFQFYYIRLTNIITRFEARLDILATAGKDTAPSAAKLAAAETKLAAAKLKGEQAVAAFRAIDPAKFAEQKQELTAARELADAARTLFQEAHRLLQDALTELKNISKPALPAASAAVREAN